MHPASIPAPYCYVYSFCQHLERIPWPCYYSFLFSSQHHWRTVIMYWLVILTVAAVGRKMNGCWCPWYVTTAFVTYSKGSSENFFGSSVNFQGFLHSSNLKFLREMNYKLSFIYHRLTALCVCERWECVSYCKKWRHSEHYSSVLWGILQCRERR